MAIDDQIINEKLQYDINKEVRKHLLYHQGKFINMNI